MPYSVHVCSAPCAALCGAFSWLGEGSVVYDTRVSMLRLSAIQNIDYHPRYSVVTLLRR